MAEGRIRYYSLSNKTDLDEPYNIRPWHDKCAKTFVIIFNTFFWLLGWILIGVGISLRSRAADINMQSTDSVSTFIGKDHASYNSAAELCLSVGCMTLIVVLLACCGAHTENHCILGAYVGIVVIILCFEIGAITVTSLYREKVEQRVISDIKFTMDVYEQPQFEAITNSIDSFQRTFHCCGCIEYEDWYNSTWGKRHRGNVPSSCLKKDSILEVLHQKRINASVALFDINTNGCFEYVRDYFVKNLSFFGTFVVWIIGIQLVGLAFAVCLFCKYRNRKKEITCRYQSITNEQ